MTLVLGTLPFIAILWLLTVLGAAVFEQSGAKILAALKGNSMQAASPCSAAVYTRDRTRLVLTRPVTSEWRAAA